VFGREAIPLKAMAPLIGPLSCACSAQWRWFWCFTAASLAATFGAIVPIRGHVSDIALDEGRGVVYAANFIANRIEVISMANLSLQSPIQLHPFPLDSLGWHSQAWPFRQTDGTW